MKRNSQHLWQAPIMMFAFMCYAVGLFATQIVLATNGVDTKLSLPTLVLGLVMLLPLWALFFMLTIGALCYRFDRIRDIVLTLPKWYISDISRGGRR